MMRFMIVLIAGLVLGHFPSLHAQQPVSYSKQVKPFLARYCLECHNPQELKGELDLDSFKGLSRGGKNGPVVVPGKPDASRLVLLPEGRDKPRMPPKTARQPKPGEAEVLRAWVTGGATDDSTSTTVTLPGIKPHLPVTAPITALAYGADGKRLAAASHKDVILIDTARGDVLGRLPGHTGRVTALAFAGNGTRLAVASSRTGVAGDVTIYALANAAVPSGPERTLAAHKDSILDMKFSPSHKLLATTGYDRLIKLWDVETGKELRTLKDHSDAVYGLAFSPDGLLLASAGADRAVKVWDLATGTRLYTLADATDWLYAITWRADGRHLAAAGVDKSIRVWEVSKAGGKLVHSVFAHDAPITRLSYSPDGNTVYSLAEDRVLKSWDTSRMAEIRVYDKQPALGLALAVRADHKQLAVGRFDGSLVLLEEASGKVLAQPLPEKPKPPELTKLTPDSAARGRTVRVRLEGKGLDAVSEVLTPNGVLKPIVIMAGRSSLSLLIDIEIPPMAPAGAYKLQVKGPGGISAPQSFMVDRYRAIAEVKPNQSPRTGQPIQPPMAVVGVISQAGETDWYRFPAAEGQQLGVQALTAAIDSKLEPVLQVVDMEGRVLAESTSGALGHTFAKAGEYALGIRDRDYRGNKDMFYRLQIGDVPVVTSIFPLGIQRGTEVRVRVHGVNLNEKDILIKAPADAAPGTKLPVAMKSMEEKPLGEASVVVGEYPDASLVSTLHPSRFDTMRVPGTANGAIYLPKVTSAWHFRAKKGQRLILEVQAQRLGSPLDSYLEILDSKNQPVPRATLRSVGMTYVAFRDHDSAGSGIRLETWNDLAIDDYLWVGSELMRIQALPKNPDDDCQFYAVKGQRVAFLDSTPTHHSQGSPMYKVQVHPPGKTFSSNGFPVIQLPYRNDDGGPGYGKDSRIFFDPPADGEYVVRIGDARGQGGQDYAYRLTIRPPNPGFTVSFTPTAPAVWKGSAIPISVTADRADGYDGPIDVQLDGLPAGLSAPAGHISAGQNTTALALAADSSAALPARPNVIKLVAKARIDGREIVRESAGGIPKLVEPGELVTTTVQQEVTLQPGGQVWVQALIERRNGFTGRVPLEVRGLPHGVRVLDIGLNGILITEKETQRAFALYAEPWVQPTTQPIVVLAKHERKGTEHAAKSVMLRVEEARKQVP